MRDAKQIRELLRTVLPGETWAPWRTAAAVLYALPPESDTEIELFERCTGRTQWPTVPSPRGVFIVGRRGGKSMFISRICDVEATRDFHRVLAPGERGVGMIISPDRRQGRGVKGYCSALLNAIPNVVKSETQDSITLANNITIEIHTRSFRAVRGYTVVFCVCEEMAFWANEDSANPDTEVLAAVEPAMATVPGALLLCISSPYARKGELWRAYREHYGKDGDTLVWMADTATMNRSVPQSVIDRAFERDEAVAWSEYGRDGRIEFRRDVETFISREALDACVVPGRHELPPGIAA